jgi:hypothetical protein
MENIYPDMQLTDALKKVLDEMKRGNTRLLNPLSSTEIKLPQTNLPDYMSTYMSNYFFKKEPPDKGILEMVRWLNILNHPLVILIIGSRGSGKSALGYKILEYMRWQGKLYVLGLTEKSRKILPEWIGSTPSMEDIPGGSIVLVDEAYLTFHSRSSSSQRAREISNIINLSRQREQTLIFISQEARQIDKNIASSANVVIIKNPGVLQLEFERSQFRKILVEAQRMFNAITRDKNKWAYVFAPESNFAGMMENSLPTFWTSSLSKAYVEAKPDPELKAPRKITRTDKTCKAKELRRQGYSLGEIAKILGTSKSTIKNYLDGYPYQRNKSR